MPHASRNRGRAAGDPKGTQTNEHEYQCHLQRRITQPGCLNVCGRDAYYQAPFAQGLNKGSDLFFDFSSENKSDPFIIKFPVFRPPIQRHFGKTCAAKHDLLLITEHFSVARNRDIHESFLNFRKLIGQLDRVTRQIFTGRAALFAIRAHENPLAPVAR